MDCGGSWSEWSECLGSPTICQRERSYDFQTEIAIGSEDCPEKEYEDCDRATTEECKLHF